MRRDRLLAATYLLDQLAGDPEAMPHPVRWIGAAIARAETVLRHPDDSDVRALVLGGLLTATVVGSSYLLTRTALRVAGRHTAAARHVTELLLAWTCLAARNLEQEAQAVSAALDANDLPLARKRVARIVGRDTEALDTSEVSRALIETLAESACDGILAPLFYLALGGVPLAMAYKAVNTLDSMIGHRDARYLYFGRVAARLDDVANFLPSRMTALAIIGTSGNTHAAWRTWRNDGHRHKSPNAGQPEAAMAGALRVCLGGVNTYDGELIASPHIGSAFPAPSPQEARRAIRIIARATLLAALLSCAAASYLGRRRLAA